MELLIGGILGLLLLVIFLVALDWLVNKWEKAAIDRLMKEEESNERKVE